MHALPSSQAVLFALAGFEQVLVAASQVPAVWHWSDAGHVGPAVQMPFWQLSFFVQALPSSQGAP